MRKKATNLQHRKILAREQHLAVTEFLNQEPFRSDLLEGLGNDTDSTVVRMLLRRKWPVPAKDIAERAGVETGAVSEAVKRVNAYLSDFYDYILQSEDTVIKIPRESGGGHFGYYLACFNMEIGEYLDGSDTKELFKKIWKYEIEVKLRKKLEEEARYSLSEKLDRPDDFQQLDMEIGTVDKKLQRDGINRPPEFEQPKAYDHNRGWKVFDSSSLFEPKGRYILTSDAGNGKTTYLRALQLEVLQRKKSSLIPLFLNAREIEGWGLETDDLGEFIRKEFLEKIAGKFVSKLNEDEGKIIAFLEDAFEKEQLVFLVDGLDQIRAGASEYEPLASRIIKTVKASVIIASRPSAVVALEGRDDVTFLRLKPFSRGTQKVYFDKHYERARELSANAPDLVAIPMLAYMVRTLIEKRKDKDIKNRADLYEEFIKHVLTEYRHGGFELPLGLRNEIRVNLQKISYYGLNAKEKYIQRIPLGYYNKKLLQQKLTMKADELTKSGLVNLIVESGDCLCFTHQSFQEYLAAEWARENPEEIEYILEKMWKWREVIKFLAGMLGEDFVKRIYSRGCKDNCIHSRLFLAAECCGQSYEACELEKPIFDQLTELVSEPPFEEDAISSLSRLNSSHAIDFLVAIATEPRKYLPQSNPIRFASLCELIFHRVPNKIRHHHLNYFLTMLETCSERQYKAPFMLVNVAESLAAEHFDRIVSLERLGRFGLSSPIFAWERFAAKFSSSHINQMFEFIARDEEDVKFRFLRILSHLTEIRFKWPDFRKTTPSTCAFKCHSAGFLLPRDVGLKFSPQHVEILITCAETGSARVQEAACQILTNLAGKEEIVSRSRVIEWIIHTLKRGTQVCREVVSRQLKAFSHRLSLAQRVDILNFLLDKASPSMRWIGLLSLYQPIDEPSTEELTKIVSMVEMAPARLQIPPCEILKKTIRRLSPEQVKNFYKSFKMLQPGSEAAFLAKQAWGFLTWGDLAWLEGFIAHNLVRPKCVARKVRTGTGPSVNLAPHILSRFAKHMRPEDVNKVLEGFNKIDSNSVFVSILPLRDVDFDAGELCSPIPKELTQEQIKKIRDWLFDNRLFQQKLAIELLATINLPAILRKRFTEEVFRLLSQAEPDVIEVALRALPLIHRKAFMPDSAEIVDYLRSPYPTVRRAAARYLAKREDSLTEPHLTRLLYLLEKRETDIAINVLTVLAKIAERIPEEALDRIVAMLELEPKHPSLTQHDVWSAVAKFANRLKPQHIGKLLNYIRTGKARLKVAAIKTLQEMPKLWPTDGDTFHEIIKCLQNSKKNVRTATSSFLRKVSYRLEKEHVATVVKAYKKDPANNEIYMVVRGISSKLLADHIDLFTMLLNREEIKVQIQILDVLAHIAENAQSHHIKQVEKLLYSSEDEVRTKAYQCLKTMYALSGLPR